MKRSLFCEADPAEAVIWRQGREISRAEFAFAARSLAEVLPDLPYMLNHCEDRYHFLLGLAAALLRGQVSLFPSSKAPQVLQQLVQDYPGVYCFSDQNNEPEIMRTEVYNAGAASEIGTPLDINALAFPEDQLVAVAFTSGSTGKPKPYQKLWGGFVHEAEVAGRALQLNRDRGGYIVATVPSQHMYGFMTAAVMPLQYRYITGADRPFYPEDIRKALLGRPQPCVLVTTPVQIRACVLEQTQLPDLEFILSSTAPLYKDMADQAETLFGTRVREFYGSTETGAIAVRRQAETSKWRTFDDVTVESTEEGFNVHADYFYQSPISLADSVDVLNEREFVLHGRNADLIKIGGKRISISDLNQKLLAIDGVEDGAFFLPEEEAGGRETRLAAFVVAPNRTREELIAELRKLIDAVFLPRPLRLVEALPRNDTGKLPRGNLLHLWREVQQSAESDRAEN